MDDKPKAHHIICFELVNRIIEKIRAGEPFHVYVIVPMFPEGIPDSAAVQEILHWQKNTVQMIMKRIQAAIDECGLDSTPQDYFNFYCLGKNFLTLFFYEKAFVVEITV